MKEDKEIMAWGRLALNMELHKVYAEAKEKGVLSEKAAEIMDLRYGFHDGEAHSIRDIARRVSLSRERVRQITLSAKEKLLKRSYWMSPPIL
jgi:DNA-directed RNA polymerase sigma subunit (sigma70/sigma32)